MAVEFLSFFWSGCRILKSKVAVTLVRTHLYASMRKIDIFLTLNLLKFGDLSLTLMGQLTTKTITKIFVM